MEEKVKKVLSGVGFYGTLAVCLAVVGVCGWILLRDDGGDPTEELAPVTPQVPVSRTVEMPEVEVEPEPVVETLEPANVPEELPEVTVEDTAPVMAEAPRLVVEPLRGEVLTAFSMEELVYSPTLEDWRTHDGIDIAAKAGTTVLAASAGAVLSVEDDPMMGTTVMLEHDGGYQTTYANLQAKPNVEVGDAVSVGQIIGAVGTTAPSEASQAPHLHFAVTKDGKAVNPNEFLEK